MRLANYQDISRAEIDDQSIEFLLYLYKQRSSKSAEQKSDLNYRNTVSAFYKFRVWAGYKPRLPHTLLRCQKYT